METTIDYTYFNQTSEAIFGSKAGSESCGPMGISQKPSENETLLASEGDRTSCSEEETEYYVS